MKKLLLFGIISFCIQLQMNAQNMGIRRVSFIPTAALYTPDFVKKDATVVYSEATKRLYYWNGTDWQLLDNSSSTLVLLKFTNDDEAKLNGLIAGQVYMLKHNNPYGESENAIRVVK